MMQQWTGEAATNSGGGELWRMSGNEQSSMNVHTAYCIIMPEKQYWILGTLLLFNKKSLLNGYIAK